MDWISGNIFIRPNYMKKAGDSIPEHEHNFDHTLWVPAGKALVEKLDKNDNVIASRILGTIGKRHVLIEKNDRHRITALEDDTETYCLYSHRNAQGEVSQVYTGFDEAYN